VDLARINGQIDALQDFNIVILDADVKILNF
jgi:hypothetical protein